MPVTSPVPPEVRATVAAAVLAREVADTARELICHLGPDSGSDAAGRLAAASRPRARGLHLLDMMVIVERLRYGTSWEVIAESLGMTAEVARRRWESTVLVWADPGEDELGRELAVGGDLEDLAATAEGIDAWYNRHAWEWEQLDAPVSTVTRARS
jgi:hypothetical protein